MAFSFKDLIKPAIGGSSGGLFNLFQKKPDYGPAFQQYGQELGDISKQYDPFIQGGEQAFGKYGNLSDLLTTDPTHFINQISAGYKESPYQQQMDKNLSRMMNYNSATTGMLGSTAAQSALQNQLAGQQNQFQQQYINQGLSQLGMGMGGLQDISHLGFQGLGKQTGLEQEGAMARARAAMQQAQQGAQPGGFGRFMQGAAGGILGFL